MNNPHVLPDHFFFFMVTITICFAVARFVVPVSAKLTNRDVYEDIDRIWIGAVLGICFAMTGVRYGADGSAEWLVPWGYWALLLFRSAVAVVASILRRQPSPKGGEV